MLPQGPLQIVWPHSPLASTSLLYVRSVIFSCQNPAWANLSWKPSLLSFTAQPLVRIVYHSKLLRFLLNPLPAGLHPTPTAVTLLNLLFPRLWKNSSPNPGRWALPYCIETLAFKSSSVSPWESLFLHFSQALYFSSYLSERYVLISFAGIFSCVWSFKHISTLALFPYHCTHISFIPLSVL